MGIFSKLFNRPQATLQATTVKRPFVVERPTIGFYNLLGKKTDALVAADVAALAPAFSSSKTSTDKIPPCNVLFLYCQLDAAGNVKGTNKSLRTIIKEAQACIVVIASENDGKAYVKAVGPKRDWPANIIMTLDRKGDHFAAFFNRLFMAMLEGQSMPTAWVELAPQTAGADPPGVPGAIFVAEAGHIVFKKKTKKKK